MDKLILKAIMWLMRLLKWKDFDLEKLQTIVETKLTMDKRRSRGGMRSKNQREVKNPMVFALVLYSFMGLFLSMMLFSEGDILPKLIFFHSYLMFMMVMILITDFSSVLLDTADYQIILPKPVSSKTFFVARAVHIFCYLLQLTLALMVFPIIMAYVNHGIFTGTIVLLTFFLNVLFSVFLTYLLYGLMLRFVSEQKLKEVIGGMQIFMTIAVVAGYQILPRFIDFENLNNFKISAAAMALPPVWFAMAGAAVENKLYDWLHLAMIGLTIIVPLLTIWVMMKYLAPFFSSKIGNLSAGDAGPNTRKPMQTRKQPYVEKLSKLVCKSKVQQSTFELGWKMMSRDKQFKMSFYPSLAYIVVLVAVQFLKKNSLSTMMTDLKYSNVYLWMGYMPMLGYLAGLGAMTIYANGDAGWTYYSAPVNKPGELINGAVKAFIIKFVVPISLVISICCYLVWGVKVLDDLMLSFANNLLAIYLIMTFSEKILPFSRELNTREQSGKFAKIILIFGLIAGLVGLHWLASRSYILVQLMIPISLIASYLLYKKLNNVEWKNITA